MDNHVHMTPQPGDRTGHETTDISIRGVTWFLLGLGMVLVLTGLALWWFFDQMESYASQADKPRSPVASDAAPPPPRLQKSARADMQAMREAEHAWLSSYNWVDEKSGIVRIPISEAIDRVASEGLPHWPAVQPQPQERVQP